LKPDWDLPPEIDLIYPFDNAETWDLLNKFYQQYFCDKNHRYFLFGINPGRFGAGMTGIPFTDPIQLESVCGIQNDIKKTPELSSIFIYEIVKALGGAELFYKNFYITSLCPLGFVNKGKNYNYYDSKDLFNKVKMKMIDSIEDQIKYLCQRSVAFSLGQGKNFKIFSSLNDEYHWFDEIVPLPHPRWVMQYKRKFKEIYLGEIIDKLEKVLKN
jgi:hypothetical protein